MLVGFKPTRLGRRAVQQVTCLAECPSLIPENLIPVPAPLLWIQCAAKAGHPGRQRVMAQALGSTSFTWETQMGFWSSLGC